MSKLPLDQYIPLLCDELVVGLVAEYPQVPLAQLTGALIAAACRATEKKHGRAEVARALRTLTGLYEALQ